METTAELNEADKIISFLNSKAKEKQREIEVFELQNSKVINLKNRRQLKLLFGLLIENKLELSHSRKSASIYLISLVTSKQKKEKLAHLFELYNFFLGVSRKKTWSEFIYLTSNEFSALSLSGLIKKLKLNELCIFALIKTIEGFLKGQQPVYLNDTGLSPNKFIELCMLLSDEKNLLVTEDLIRAELEKDGVSVRTTITRKTLFLISENGIARSVDNEYSVKCSLYEIIKPEKIEKTKLYFSLEMKNTFDDFCKLSFKIKKSENLSLLLHGVSGTGKTAFAHQLAKQINGVIYKMDFSQIQSKWIGETEKNVNRVFSAYNEFWKKSSKPVILLINEADGLMNKRISINSSNDVFSNQIQTELLEQLEKFNGILIATTNLLNNIDNAFRRRFLYITEVIKPDNNVRSSYLRSSVIYSLLSVNQIFKLENASWTIAEIKNIERKINLIQRVRKLSQNDLEQLLLSEGVLTVSRQQIGYRFEL
jgi:AAA+ superfamily predicted ATPase